MSALIGSQLYDDRPTPRPLFPEVGVVALVPDAWDGAWQPRHYTMARLAQYFHVVWLNPAHAWRDGWVRWRTTRTGEVPVVRHEGGMDIYQPEWWAPRMHRSGLPGMMMERFRCRRALALLRRRGCTKSVLYLWRPECASLLDQVPHDLSCYHLDDENSVSSTDQPIASNEAELMRRVDQVFIPSPALLEHNGGLNPHTLFAPNGVDYTAYAQSWEEPEDLAAIPQPRIGYIGTINAQLDLGLVLTLSTRHPGWSFVFVGPQGDLGNQVETVQQLWERPNVHFLGEKPVASLPAYGRHVDACIMPYGLDGSTKGIYPLTLHASLAGSRPVVGTPIRSLHHFSKVVKLATTPDEWSRALHAVLSPAASTLAEVRKRQAVARNHDWAILVNRLAFTICSRLGVQSAADSEPAEVEARRLPESVSH